MHSSVQFSSVVSDSLRPHESQHARPPCPSQTPIVHSDSRPSSQWCHPAISSSVVPFSSCPQSLPASESFPVSQLSCTGIVKITADGDCSHEIKKTLAPWKESYDKPRQCIKTQRQHFANTGLYRQSYDFPPVMYGWESWSMKKAEHRRIDAFELWCCGRL